MRKKIYNNLLTIGLIVMLISCEENEALPGYQKKGTATHTVASIAASKTTPAASETISVTMNYVNPSADPVKSLTLKAKVGAADYVDVVVLNEESATKNSEITREVDYDVPTVSAGTKIVLDMVITSQKEYPQIKRLTITVQ